MSVAAHLHPCHPGHRRRACLRALLWWPTATTLGLAPSGCVVLPALSGFVHKELLTALMERLDRETERALQRLGLAGGFALDPKVRLALPPGLRLMRRLLVAAGYGEQVVKLEFQLNATAERVAAVAHPVVRALLPLLPWQDEAEFLRLAQADPVETLRRLAAQELRTRLEPLAAQAAQATGLSQTWSELQAVLSPLKDVQITANAPGATLEKLAKDAARNTLEEATRDHLDPLREALEQGRADRDAARAQLDDARRQVKAASELDLGDARRYVADRVVDALFVKLHEAYAAWPQDTPPAPVETARPRPTGP